MDPQGNKPNKPAVPQPNALMTVEQLLTHFEELEEQFRMVREGLTHSHRLATLGTIASIIAHEYNNILTPMVSYAHMALAKPGDHELMKKAVEKALQGAERAAHISTSLLGFAREADQRHAANLPNTVKEAVGCLARDPQKDGIDLVVELPDVQVAMSPLNLVQVFVNLLLNAKQAMRKTGGQIRIRAELKGNLVHLDVADNGPGIPPQIKDKLFEPFVTHQSQQDSAGKAPERKGTGLGLCICRDLIRNAGGSIAVESEPGKGATFHITLPVADNLFETT